MKGNESELLRSCVCVSVTARVDRDFVGGMHKRRLERQRTAKAEAEEIDRLAKIEARRLKRIEVRQRIEMDKLTNPFADDDDNAGNDADDAVNNDSEPAALETVEHWNATDGVGGSIVDEAESMLNGGASKLSKKRKRVMSDDSKQRRSSNRDGETNDNEHNDDNGVGDDAKQIEFRGDDTVATVVVEPVSFETVVPLTTMRADLRVVLRD
jgi:hypothetical protein